MRGDQSEPEAVFSYITPAQRVPKDHPLRAIRTMVDEVLRRLWSDFEKLYSHTGRPSIPPERLLRALLLQVLYSIRSAKELSAWREAAVRARLKPDSATAGALGKEELERLRSLGYIQ